MTDASKQGSSRRNMTGEELADFYSGKGSNLPILSYRLITPEFAAEVLREKNRNNRKIRQQRVNQYARDILRGDWELSSQGIAFDEDGYLLDGQHRLAAIVKANVAVYMPVAENVPRSAGAIIDMGQKRTAAQALKLTYSNEVEKFLSDPSILAGIRKIILMHDPERDYSSVPTLDLISFGMRFSEEMKITQGLVHNCLPNRTNADVTAAIMAALICGEKPEAVKGAVEVYGRANAKGIDRNKYDVDTVLKFRRFIDDQRVADMKLARRSLYIVMQQVIYKFAHPDWQEMDFTRIPEHPAYDCTDAVQEVLYSEFEVEEK